MKLASRLFALSLLACATFALAQTTGQTPRWQTLPPKPAPYPGETHGFAEIGGIKLYYAIAGTDTGQPAVVLLHGGLANSDYWTNQVRAPGAAPSRYRGR